MHHSLLQISHFLEVMKRGVFKLFDSDDIYFSNRWQQVIKRYQQNEDSWETHGEAVSIRGVNMGVNSHDFCVIMLFFSLPPWDRH